MSSEFELQMPNAFESIDSKKQVLCEGPVETVQASRAELLEKLHSRLKTCSGKKTSRHSNERFPVNGGTMPEKIFEKLINDFTDGILKRNPGEDRAKVEQTIREIIRKINETFKKTDLKKLMSNPKKLSTLISEMAKDINPSFLL